MRNILLSGLRFIIVIFILAVPASSSDTVLYGSVFFTCSLSSDYMQKHGYVLVEKDLYISNLKVDRYAAGDAEVLITDQAGTVLGTVKTDPKGYFSISVPEGFNYRVLIRYHEREIEHTVAYSDARNITAHLGYFDTDTVDSWISVPPLYDCYTCDIRYLENNKKY